MGTVGEHGDEEVIKRYVRNQGRKIDAWCSLNLPPSKCIFPRCILPFKKVPVATITASAFITSFVSIFTPHILLFFTIKDVTSDCNISRFI